MAWQGPSVTLRCAAQKQELSISGRSWGQAAVEGSNLVFSVNGKTAFRVPLQDVGQVQTSVPSGILC